MDGKHPPCKFNEQVTGRNDSRSQIAESARSMVDSCLGMLSADNSKTENWDPGDKLETETIESDLTGENGDGYKGPCFNGSR